MDFLLRRLGAPLVLSALALPAGAQTPKTWLPLDGSTTDQTGTTTQSVSGGTPSYAADRFGNGSSAWTLNGFNDYLTLSTGSGNSALDLGMKGAFTAAAWIRPDTPGSGTNVVFGRGSSGTGAMHHGLQSGEAFLGMDGNNLAGNLSIESGQWYHVTYQYDGTNQNIYVNGILDATRAAANTTADGDALVGRAWASSNAFDGRLDDVVIFGGALTQGEILNLVGTRDPSRLDNCPADPLPGNLGSAGNWGIREVKGHSSIGYNKISNALAIAHNQSGGSITDGSRPRLNLSDPQTSNNAGNFGGDLAFVSDTGGADNNFALIGQAFVNIPAAGDYTFGFSGDDGARLRIWGQNFTSAVTTQGGNDMDPPFAGDHIIFTNPTGNGTVLGVVNLQPGVYFLEHVWWEGGGGAWTEVYAAAGAKTSFDNSFDLVGDTANGGLQIVAPQPLVKFFEADSNVVVSGSPANITFSWDTVFGDTFSIDNGVGAVSGGSHTIASPASTTTYTLTANHAGGGSATAQVTVFVDPVPQIVAFQADDDSVPTGAPVTLTWETIGGATYTLNPGSIDVTGDTTGDMGSRVLNPTSTTTYTLTVTNPNGTATSDPVTITVGTGPTINSFTVNDANPAPGAVLTLGWDVTDFDTLTIDPDVGEVTTLAQALVCPSNDTTYTLTASNGFGSTTAQVSVTTAEAIGVSSAGFTVRFAASTGSVGNLAAADNVLAGNGLAQPITVLTNVAGVNYSDVGSKGEVVGDASMPPGYGDNFAMEATATLVVNVAGSYTFAINNDDGGRLRIDGNTVINDDALHGPTTSTANVNLSAGNHTIVYVFFELGGGASGELFLQPQPGIANLLQTTGNLGAISTPTVIINEIMADNDNDVIVDGDGDASDWIELYNGTGAAVDISGWHLTDDPLLLNKWPFPASTIIPDGGHLLVWASDKALGIPPAGELHTNFKLSSNGEYLALVAANGTTVVDEISPTFPPQSNGVSWGTFDTEQFTGYFIAPTPGGRNIFGYDGLVGDTTFSHDRGFYDASFQLSITSSTPGAVIYYTTNGDEPTDKNATVGTVYTGPITVDSTTVIRARATKPGFFPSNVDTQSYIFPADVVLQNDAHAHGLGFPDTNVNGQRFEYGINLSAGGGAAAVETALKAIPTLSLVLDQHDFSGPSGIYVNAGSRGLERAGSIELINEDGLGLGQLQENCGVRIRGGFSRSNNNPKHAFRLFFRKTYGAGKLNYPLFGDEGANEFDGVDLRTSQNYSWAFQNSNQNTFLREVWGRDTQREMGQPYTRSRYYHLYINGHYWGLFMTQERAEADFGETYFGGVDDDYDTIKSAGSAGGYRTETTDGDFGDWNLLWDWDNGTVSANPSNANYFAAQGLQSDGITPNGGPVLLDVDNLADYMLVIFYDGSFDAPLSTFLNNASNNWFSVRNRVADDMGFAFFIHDNEHGMGSANDSRSDDRTGPWGAVYGTIGNQDRSNPQYIHEDLAKNAEYRLAFADRAHAALVAPGGPLTLAEAKVRVNARAATVETVIDAEAARWGSNSLNKSAWMGARDRLLDWLDDGDSSNGGPDRTQVVLTQLRNYADGALYPNLDAPVYNQQGGNVSAGFNLTMTNPDGVGTIYYTLDGTDPRVPVTGAINGTAYSGAVTLNATTTVRARVRNGAEWSAMNEATFLVGSLADATNLVISQIYYNPPGSTELDEYIEIMNISGSEIELAGLSFASGLTFDFSTAADTTLDPGERALIVKDLAAFNATFAAYLPVHILGVYTGSLSNSGERLALLDAAGGTIQDFSYNDKSPWPEAPDGDGASLVLIDPTSNPDHSVATNWRPSANLTGGTPGQSTAVGYGPWKTTNGVVGDNSDDDGDGLDALAEYGFGGDPNSADSAGILPTALVQTLTVNTVTDDYLTISFRRVINAEDATFSVEVSEDLNIWNGGPTFVVEHGDPVHNGDGTETLTYRTVDPVSTDFRLFIRATVTVP